MSHLKKCFRCKEKFPEDQLQTDERLHPTLARFYCRTCLVDVLIDQVVICELCKKRYVFYGPIREVELLGYQRCAECRCKNVGIGYLYNHLARARTAGTPDTLTHDEWTDTVRDFGGYCAYCLRRPYDVIEHFVPIVLGGGTEKSNCVPACYPCNSKKSHFHPDLVSSKFAPGAIDRVRNYLEQF
jgi:5-methylcytosine-specific restriction endonuclease McrA